MTSPLSIAIIGMSGRFPGANSLEQFWLNLRNGIESIDQFSIEEMIACGVPEDIARDPEYVAAKGIIDNISGFDAEFFGFSPREASHMDPQHRIFLECAWEALEHAGYDPLTSQLPIGLYAGCGDATYLYHLLQTHTNLADAAKDPSVFFGNYRDFFATRVAYRLNLRGPSINIQTACSTSLVAIHSACSALLSYQCDIAIAGGIHISLPHKSGNFHEHGGVVSPDGHCRAFDEKAAGTVASDGAGVVILKRLDDAIADGDTIHAVILGSAVNNDGSDKIGYTAPSVNGQSEVIMLAQEMAEIDPTDISYVEAHGTGTKLGDPIEIQALTQAFSRNALEKGYCAIGSLKTNIGHLDAAAGVAGLIKTVLALKHQEIPPSLNFNTPNPAINFEDSPFFVNHSLREWTPRNGKRIAGVSSFGIGGTNAHVIVGQAPEKTLTPSVSPIELIVLSARTESALLSIANNLSTYLRSHPNTLLANVAHTLQVGRHAFKYRVSMTASSAHDAANKLDEWISRKSKITIAPQTNRRIGFLFPGQGLQCINMGRSLYDQVPAFKEIFDQGARIAQLHLDKTDLTRLLYPTDESSETQTLVNTQYAQPALFLVEYSLARFLESIGLRAETMLGHSIGEWVAACLAGVFSFEDALKLVCIRGKLMQSCPTGSMLGVELAENELLPFLNNGLEISVHNAQKWLIVSGSTSEIEKLKLKLESQEIICHPLRVSHAFHSASMEQAREAFTNHFESITLLPPERPFISNLTGTWITDEQACSPEYWAEQLRAPVKFYQGFAKAQSDSNLLWLEVGPGRSLSQFARLCDEPSVISCWPQPQLDTMAQTLDAIGRSWVAGAQPDWKSLHQDQNCFRIPLPTYPFEHKHYWVDALPLNRAINSVESLSTRESPFLTQSSESEIPKKNPDLSRWFYVPEWKSIPLNPQHSNQQLDIPTLIILGTNTLIHSDFVHEFKDAILVKIGDRFRQIDSRHFEISSTSRPDYESLLNALDRQEWKPRRIIHTTNLEPFSDSSPDADRASKRYLELLCLAQALGKCSPDQHVEIVILINQLFKVTQSDLHCPDKATILGPAKVIPLEYSAVTCRIIDLDAESLERPSLIFSELAQMQHERTIAYRNGQRYTESYQPEILESQRSESRLKDRGHYLITGGLGGVGLALAEHLIRRVNAKVTLINRSDFPARENWNALLKGQNLPVLSENLDQLHATCENFKRIFSIPTLDRYDGLSDGLTYLAQRCIQRYFSSALNGSGQISIDTLRQRLSILPRFERMFEFMLTVLNESSFASIRDGILIMQPDTTVPTEELVENFPEFRGLIKFVDYCCQHYDLALSGRQPSIQVLYPEGKTDRLDLMQRETIEYSQQRIYSHALSDFLNKLSAIRPLRVLEIGGGQGLLTRIIAPKLLANGSSFHFTDISPFFTNRILQAIPDTQGMTTGVFDITRDPASQGLLPGSFDVIVGLDVVHATPNIGTTIGYLRQLLTPSGYLGLLETVTTGPWVDLCWGLADGWWLYEDEALRNSPLMHAEQWETALNQIGFKSYSVLPKNPTDRQQCDVALILAQNNSVEQTGIIPAWQAEASQDPVTINRYRIEKILELERLGGEVHIISADIGHHESTDQAVRLSVERFGAINGVIHSAMVLEDKLMQLKDPESAQRVFTPKIKGSLNLLKALDKQPLDFFVHCSSLAAPMGLYAQSDYCAATSFQDALVKSLKPEISLSINWGVWRDAGFAMRMKLKELARSQRWSPLPGPLLERFTRMSTGSFIFEGLLSDQWIIHEHHLNGLATLPGTGYLSYVKELFDALLPQRSELNSLIFSEPLKLTQGQNQPVRIKLDPESHGYTLTIASLSEDRWIENARGIIDTSDSDQHAEMKDPMDALHRMQKRFGYDQSAQSEISNLIEEAYHHAVSVGQRWKGLLSWKSIQPREAFALLELPSQYHHDLESYPLHAAMLDIATSFAMGDEAFYLPIAYSKVKIHAPLTRKIWSHLSWERNADSKAPTISFSVQIFNEDGKLSVEIEEYTLRKVTDSNEKNHEPRRLICESAGILDSLKYVPMSAHATLDENEVEIQVTATGLNFLDVLSALGMSLQLPTSESGIGRECAGIVSRVGSNVIKYKAGDPVIAVASNAYDDLVYVHQQNIRIKPDAMEWATAASFSVPFMTAHFALNHRAKLRKGETVLIHAAAGGVGMAAIQLARMTGAKLIVTAGSEEKRKYLREMGIEHVFDSRSNSFVDNIREFSPRGVDVVLNCLGGELMLASLGLLAPHGRFLELGKRDFAENRQIGLSAFSDGVTYFSINLGPQVDEYEIVFDEIIDMFSRGLLKPLPIKTYPVEETAQAFADMAAARHIGKLVVTRPSGRIKHKTLITFAGVDAPMEDPQLREGMSSHEGAEAFERALSSRFTQVLVTPQDFTALLKLNSPEKVRRAKEISAEKSTAQTLASKPIASVSKNESLLDIVRESWIKHLGVANVDPNDNFFSLGGDSLIGIQIMAYLRKQLGIEIPVAIFFEAPTLNELTTLLDQLKGKSVSRSNEHIEFKISPHQRYTPFPLTDVQQAYWIGRSNSFELGNVAAHGYFEVERKDLDYPLFCEVWMQLINRHDMLRMIVNQDGQQEILEHVGEYCPELIDLRSNDSKSAESFILALRAQMSGQILPSDQWPLFDIKVTLLPDSSVRIHMSFDALIMDAWSSMILGREFSDLYHHRVKSLPTLEMSFRDYVMYEQSIRDSSVFEKSKRYWMDRLNSLPAAPELPLAINPESLQKPTFTRRESRLSKDKWIKIKEFAAQAGLTPSAVCLTCFGDVLARWSQNGHFSINLTLFNRPAVHPQINEIVGDFTSLTLLEIDTTVGETYVQRARRIQQQLGRDLDHRHFSGVQVLRELVRSGKRQSGAIMPVVFTSTLALDSQQHQHSPVIFDGEIVYGISQTPQVWLDHGILEEDGELVLNWNAVEALFPANLLDDMFEAYLHALSQLAEYNKSWEQPANIELPAQQQQRRLSYNNTSIPLEITRLETGFFKQTHSNPTSTALYTTSEKISFETLASESLWIANELRCRNIKPGECIGVHLIKGWKQIAVVLGILRAGGAYVPLDPSLPLARLEAMTTGMKLAITTRDNASMLPLNLSGILIEDITVDNAIPPLPESLADLAYVIYTSGSTGKPKGVMIEHDAAMNTISDLVKRFEIDRQDRILALSALGFDLSVFDIFGLLGCGGSMVLPDPDGLREPNHWHSLLTEHQVTIWNTVPALMELLIDYVESNGLDLPTSLRLIMLSGDWIPTHLPARIKKFLPNAEIISLGGATEASIWSIYYPIGKVSSTWKSIPYGYPLANQTYHVLNAHGENCPDWVTGELYIGGVGLSAGYWQNQQQTDERFITIGNERLYRTGDLGRFWPDGWIEFQGRNDHQVKIQGYRIEIGEIETALRKHPRIIKCAVKPIGQDRGAKRLAAYIILNSDQNIPDQEEFRQFLRQQLPDYMIPRTFTVISQLPLSSNGKIDYSQLPDPADQHLNSAAKSPVTSALGKKIIELISDVLKIDEIDLNANLLDLGADSISMIRLANRMQSNLAIRPSIADLYRIQSIAELIEFCEQANNGSTSQLSSRPPQTSVMVEMITDPEERQDFKNKQSAIRQFSDDFKVVALNSATDGKRFAQRKSQRHFSLLPIDLLSFGNWLSGIRQIQQDDQAKYLYASAGGLYPVQTYIYIKAGRISGLEEGLYYHDPIKHHLVLITSERIVHREHFDPVINQPIFDEAAFCVFFIASMSRIEPMYGEHSARFAHIEAGLMSQILDLNALEAGIGLCHIGEINVCNILNLLPQENKPQWIFSLLGGVPSEMNPSAHEDTVTRLLAKVNELSPEQIRQLLEAKKGKPS